MGSIGYFPGPGSDIAQGHRMPLSSSMMVLGNSVFRIQVPRVYKKYRLGVSLKLVIDRIPSSAFV